MTHSVCSPFELVIDKTTCNESQGENEERFSDVIVDGTVKNKFSGPVIPVAVKILYFQYVIPKVSSPYRYAVETFYDPIVIEIQQIA